MSEPELSARLAARPRDRHGRIVAWTLGHHPETGEPMMGTNDAALVARSILERRCGICGDPLDYWIAFVGDDTCVSSRVFVEPPMHEGCARYSIAVCPYLAATEGFEIRRQRAGVVVLADRSRPEKMALYITRQFEPYHSPRPPFIPAAKAAAPRRVEWLTGAYADEFDPDGPPSKGDGS